ncbi:Le.flp1-like protein [Schizophyllum commune Tattone D]|nr:Le.flp1-like protein [Schizophyllum commune Tattone D]
MVSALSVVALSGLASLAAARDIWIQVGGNTSDNASAVFQPQQVTAQLNDIVFFNFTQGNHTVTQSLFASPCIPANLANSTINGFDSGFRDAGNFTAITQLSVPITPQIENQTLWFYDYNTCGEGGVGGINVNDSDYENLEAFTRNAERLNGSDSDSDSSSSSSSRSATRSATAHTSSETGSNGVLGLTVGSASKLAGFLGTVGVSLAFL